MKRFLTGLLCLLCLHLAFAPAAAEAASYDNPLVLQRADPSVYKHVDGYYYMTYSVPAYDRIALRRATTIAGLATAPEKTIWTRHPSGEMSANIWAPWLDYVNGVWYVYFAAASTSSTFDHRTYVLSNSVANPVTASGWVERGKVVMNWESFTIDSTTFEFRGTRYMVWAQKDPAIAGNSNIYIAPMNGPFAISGTQVRLSRPEYGWEKINGTAVNEAPAVLNRNGKIFITYSTSATDANYNMGMLTADEDSHLLTSGSWSKSSVPVFQSSEANGMYGPGSNTFTTDTDGSVVNIYHARNYKSISGSPLFDPNRATYAQVVNWRADGSPDFGIPTAAQTPVTLVNRNSGKCADVQQPNLGDRANVGQYSCNKQNWQRWHLIDLKNGFFEILSVNSGKVLAVDKGSPPVDANALADGANVVQNIWATEATQQWQKVTTTAPWFRLVNRASGKVLDVANCKTGDGDNVRQWAWLNNNCQQWQAVP